jgi:hypothetical protein
MRNIAEQRACQEHRFENITNGTTNDQLEVKYNEAAVTIPGEFAVRTEIYENLPKNLP